MPTCGCIAARCLLHKQPPSRRLECRAPCSSSLQFLLIYTPFDLRPHLDLHEQKVVARSRCWHCEPGKATGQQPPHLVVQGWSQVRGKPIQKTKPLWHALLPVGPVERPRGGQSRGLLLLVASKCSGQDEGGHLRHSLPDAPRRTRSWNGCTSTHSTRRSRRTPRCTVGSGLAEGRGLSSSRRECASAPRPGVANAPTQPRCALGNPPPTPPPSWAP